MKGTLCICSLFLACIPLIAEAETTLEAHALSYFKIGEREYGFPGTLYYGRILHARSLMPELRNESDKLDDDVLNEAIARKVQKNGQTVMFRLDEVLKNRLDFFLLQNILKSNGSTVLITIPPPYRIIPGAPEGCTEAPMLQAEGETKMEVCIHDQEVFHQSTMDSFNDFLIDQKSRSTVAVVEEGDEILKVMRQSGEAGGLLGAVMRYNTKSPGHKKQSNYTSFNILGTLNGSLESMDSEGNKEADQKPRQLKGQEKEPKPKVVICASLDTFSLLQSYRASASNNSGLIAALELARLLEGIDQSEHEVIILLTTGSVLNFHGAVVFANSYADIDQVELVLCLDDLSSPELYVHLSSKAKTFSQLFQLYLSGSVTDTLKRGVNVNAKSLSYQHEQFTRQKVHAITLTSSKDLRPMPVRQRSFDYHCNQEVLAEHIINIAQALSKALQGHGLTIDEAKLQSNIAEWEEKLSKPRCPLTRDLHKDEGVREIVKHIRSLVTDMATQKVSRKCQGFEYYSSEPLEVVFYTTRPTLYYLLVFIGVCVYILLVWSLIRGSPRAMYSDIVAMMSDTPAKTAPAPVTPKTKDRTSGKYKIV